MVLAASVILPGFITLTWNADILVPRAALTAIFLQMPHVMGLSIAAIFARRMRSKSAPDDACPGRSPGTLLVSSSALYYYSLRSAL
jgi:hypothetical protein